MSTPLTARQEQFISRLFDASNPTDGYKWNDLTTIEQEQERKRLIPVLDAITALGCKITGSTHALHCDSKIGYPCDCTASESAWRK